MNTFSHRSLQVALFVFVAFLLVAGSLAFAESDPVVPHLTPNPNFTPYGRVGVGSWENDNSHCPPLSQVPTPTPTPNPKPFLNCMVDTDLVKDFVQAMKDWVDAQSELVDPEIWIMETSTSLIYLCGESLAQQVDSYKCKGKTVHMRNYVGRLQKALGDQGIVNRWSWYADRYGDFGECHPDTPTTTATNERQHDGEMTALNELCGPTAQYPNGIKLSPFARNFKLSAQYR